MASTSHQPDDYLAQHLRDALAADARVSELGLDVALRHGELYVTGTVSTEERRAAVDAVAAEVAPGRAVHNATTVVHYDRGGGTETLS
jgi:osmotically-inducible protein OsmY